MAWREGRSSWRRLLMLVVAEALGVGALTAVHSFSDQLQASVYRQGRELLGADLVLGSSSPFTPRAEEDLSAMLRSEPGAEASRVTRFSAMVYVPGQVGARLAQVTAIDGGYPFYGAVHTSPEGKWDRLGAHGALVDPGLLLALGAHVGDTLALGEARLTIAGEIAAFPGEVSIRSAFGPRVFMSARQLADTRLLGFGARVRYEAYVRLPANGNGDRLAGIHRAALAEERVSLRTVQEEENNVNRWLGRLDRYLRLVALMALLMAGLALASAVHVFVQGRMETLAVLRCLGASGGQLFAVFLVELAVLGAVGSLVGVGLGVPLTALLPRVLAGLLPLAVSSRPSVGAATAALACGLSVALVAGLQPLLAVRRVSPLAVFRRPYEPANRVPLDAVRVGAALVAAASLALIAVAEARDVATGLAFAASIGVVAGGLALAAWGLRGAARRFLPARWPYAWRQGVANLFRPANQTVMVVLALGFGAFLLDTLFIVQRNLLGELRVERLGGQPNVALFDIQPDQRPGLETELDHGGFVPSATLPVVPMRIRSVKGVLASGVLGRGGTRSDQQASEASALRREYRSTYRDFLTRTERTVGGAFWKSGGGRDDPSGRGPVPISMEKGLARQLGVRVGDEIEWDVQGVTLTSRVGHMRDVEWTRFEPNFFVVFPSGPLDRAPQTYVMLVRVDQAADRVRLARHVAEVFPNISVLDLSDVQRTIESVLARAAQVVRFMASFSLLVGASVLIGAVATSRDQRRRETVLLRTLGATRGQLLRIALAEYTSVGLLAATVALLLSVGAGWALTRFVFDQRFALPLGPLVGLGAGLVLACIGVGVSSAAEILRRPPLAELRRE